MVSFYTTWAGTFSYENPRMPLLRVTLTFEERADGGFQGYVSESPLVLPEEFIGADINLHTPRLLNAWGSVVGEIVEGQLTDKLIPQHGRSINFVKMPEQVSGSPIVCRGAFNAETGMINGIWGTVETGQKGQILPYNLKHGYFTLRQPNGGTFAKTPTVEPKTPELLFT